MLSSTSILNSSAFNLFFPSGTEEYLLFDGFEEELPEEDGLFDVGLEVDAVLAFVVAAGFAVVFAVVVLAVVFAVVGTVVTAVVFTVVGTVVTTVVFAVVLAVVGTVV